MNTHDSHPTSTNTIQCLAAACGRHLAVLEARFRATCFSSPITGLTLSGINGSLLYRVLKKKFLNRQANRRLDVLIRILIEDVAPHYDYIRKASVSKCCHNCFLIIDEKRGI
jgi:hypothetical protein